MDTSESGNVRCASFARQIDADPIGTAPVAEGFLLIEWPVPWPRDIRDILELAPVLAAADARKLRVQLVRRVTPVDESSRRVSVYTRPETEWFAGFVRRTVSTESGGIVGAALSLLHDPGAGVDHTDEIEILVCAHGARDTCCGSHGTRLSAALAAESWRTSAPVTVWRSSHLGGHRFAPTALILPEGTAWAFLDVDVARRVVERTGDAAYVTKHYRGCVGIRSQRAQAVERIALGDIGWSLLASSRHAVDGRGNTVRLAARIPDGPTFVWDALVVPGRSLPLPICRRPLEEACDAEPELIVSAYTKTENKN